MTNVLELREVSLTYHSPEGETAAIEGLSFAVEAEEFVALIGPSGCGKTTVLSLLAGLLRPSSGRILIGGTPPRKGEGATGLMPQRDQLFEWRSVLSNVLLAPEIARKKSPERVAYAKGLLEKYGLGAFQNKRPSELSGGMRQRAALIRTLVGKPEVLLLDEPFSALDFQTRLHVCDDVHRILKAEHKSALMVTHDVSEAISMADKIVVLTARPARVKAQYHILLNKTLPPSKRRECDEFARYFRRIRQDLEEQA